MHALQAQTRGTTEHLQPSAGRPLTCCPSGASAGAGSTGMGVRMHFLCQEWATCGVHTCGPGGTRMLLCAVCALCMSRDTMHVSAVLQDGPMCKYGCAFGVHAGQDYGHPELGVLDFQRRILDIPRMRCSLQKQHVVVHDVCCMSHVKELHAWELGSRRSLHDSKPACARVMLRKGLNLLHPASVSQAWINTFQEPTLARKETQTGEDTI